eukprot:38567-Prymnesium_polylepis.2
MVGGPAVEAARRDARHVMRLRLAKCSQRLHACAGPYATDVGSRVGGGGASQREWASEKAEEEGRRGRLEWTTRSRQSGPHFDVPQSLKSDTTREKCSWGAAGRGGVQGSRVESGWH